MVKGADPDPEPDEDPSDPTESPLNSGKVNGTGNGSSPKTLPNATGTSTAAEPEVDEFGLPIKKFQKVLAIEESSGEEDVYDSAPEGGSAASTRGNQTPDPNREAGVSISEPAGVPEPPLKRLPTPHSRSASRPTPKKTQPDQPQDKDPDPKPDGDKGKDVPKSAPMSRNGSRSQRNSTQKASLPGVGHKSHPSGGVSEWSHQQIVKQEEGEGDGKHVEDAWEEMPAFAPYDIYDDNGKLIAKEADESDDEAAAYQGLGGAGKGYTRVNVDEDAQSATSMDENTKYLFTEPSSNVNDVDDEDARDPLAQLQATKDLLTEQQRVAYVGVVRLAMVTLVRDMERTEKTRATKKEILVSVDALKMWSQKMMVRLYAHMDISSAEQIMIEQLAEHDLRPEDLTPTLKQNSRVKNPMARDDKDDSSPRPTSSLSHRPSSDIPSSPSGVSEGSSSPPPPPYQEIGVEGMPEVRTPTQLPDSKNIDIDLRWTVLCDMFLVLIADSVYDARSRTLLERVGSYLDVPWLEICRFEKRVTDALEMQEAASKETWNEDEHLENRRKQALKRRYVMMGLATVGGSLVIGLSAGLLAPVIGAGLAAGFTTVGVAGTSGFLAGTGGAAVITTLGVTTGGTIAVRASGRRLGHVKTFEYRPLHNNKRVNLILTVAGWMNGKIDDVRLPYSTVDPVMGDIYSLLWEPEMLQSMGQTINILATEALTQGLQQVLGSTVLVALMASLQLPIVLAKLSYLIDNPWSVSLVRAEAAGLILADSLIDRNLGARPITLVGFSLGARLIFSCLKELTRKGAFGLIQNVYLFGAPIVAKKDEYLRVRTVISGRFVNGYAKNDWILGYLFRATSGGIMRVAGLAPVENIQGLENIDVTEIVNGHMAYRAAMPKLLREVGWMVTSDEFAEIEDPDPENHEKRQREIIREIDEARKELDKETKKSRFAFFSRTKKAPEKKEWETYDDKMRDAEGSDDSPETSGRDVGGNVLFDIDAIRAELASEQIQVKQLESTLPPMKLSLSPEIGGTNTSFQSIPANLRETKSFDSSMVARRSDETNSHRPSEDTRKPAMPEKIAESVVPPYTPHDPDEEPIQMSFEPAHDSPRLSSSPQPPFAPTPPLAPRPELKTASTMPISMPGLEHNAWLDDDDLGPEREVTMSFE